MKKIGLIFSLLLSCAYTSHGQIATDFNVLDCTGNPHHLFAELDAGKVVVITWVMPCEFCIADAIDAYVAVNSFSSSHPGRVYYYLVDDIADNNCQTLTAWGNNFGLANCPKFSDPAISMDDYGGFGMPKIVVLGGSHHQVYFNKENSTAGIYAAINNALIGENTVGLQENRNSRIKLSTFPNPVQDDVELTYTMDQSSTVRLDVFDVTGKLVWTYEDQEESGKHSKEIHTDWFNSGIYIVQISTEIGVETVRFTVSH